MHVRGVFKWTTKSSRLPRLLGQARLYASKKSLEVPKFSSVSQLATLLKVPYAKLQQTMSSLGFVNTSWDYILDADSAALIADEFGYEIRVNTVEGENLYPQPLSESAGPFPSRPPVVAIMGHVDHGKTTILDYFRKSHIVAGEKGGITQHIGAFLTQLGDQKVCFLDTPGHEAFLKLRERGAHLTDFVLLVVAADDSVMPQTKEAIKHANSAGVPLVVAITKCDKPEADYDKTVSDLAAAGVQVEPYGGDTQCVKVSARTGEGMPELVSCIQAQSEIQDVRAPQGDFSTEGVIVESSVSKGLGVTASMIVKKGILKHRQYLVAGTAWCRVRQLTNEYGKQLQAALPGVPVSIPGWKGIPEPGDIVLQSDNEHQVKRVIETRERERIVRKEARQVELMNEIKERQSAELERNRIQVERKKLGLNAVTEVSNRDSEIGPKILWFLIKADTMGSAEALRDIVSQLGNQEVRAEPILSEVGAVTESDIFRAENSEASIVAFATSVPKPVQRLADQRKVQILKHDVIYRAMQDVSSILSSHLEPIRSKNIISAAEIKQIFSISLKKKQKLPVAGVKVTRGSFSVGMQCQVVRQGKPVHTGKIQHMQHGKAAITEAHKGSEYGFTFGDWSAFEEGDIVEGYEDIITPRYI